MSGKSGLSQEQYEELLKPLSKELSAMARWVSETGQRVVIVFEGRDTAGKGGSIDMFARVLNPRQCRIVALPGPSERERTQWYFQRYVEHFPAKGEIVLFDRMPDTELPVADVPWPPLQHEPLKERYEVLEPIPSFEVPEEVQAFEKRRDFA